MLYAMPEHDRPPLGFWAVVAIGVGGMVGGGIFAVLGLAVQLARGGTALAFLLAGFVALLTAYSYSRLSVAFPSAGGTVEFLNRAFGRGLATGAANLLLWLSYVIMLSLYAYAFGSYGATFVPEAAQPLARHALISGAVVFLTLLNALGSRAVGAVEEWIVGFKIAILLLFIVGGLWSLDAARLAPAAWSPPFTLAAGGMIIFLAYEGFELIANSAPDVKNPERTLPRAYFVSVVSVIVLYALVAIVTVGNLPIARIVAARDYALAQAAEPFLGHPGFTLIAIAAMLSTASAINATLYGTARVSYVIAKEGELPAMLEHKVWRRPLEGLLLTAGLTLVVANLFDLTAISLTGSGGFLLIFAAVNVAGYRLRDQTGAAGWLCLHGATACLLALAALVWHTARMAPIKLSVLGVMAVGALAVEWIYRKATGRRMFGP